MVPVFDVRIPLWGFNETPKRPTMETTLASALARLEPLRSLLQKQLDK